MKEQLLVSNSEYSSSVRCSNCAISIVQVTWKRCSICGRFNLCVECETYPYDKLQECARDYHAKVHQSINDTTQMNAVPYNSVAIRNMVDIIEDPEKILSIALAEKRIRHDKHLPIVIGKLKELRESEKTDANKQLAQTLSDLIVDYQMYSFDRKVHVLSLDGGGVRGYMPICVLQELILDTYLSDIEDFDFNNIEHRERFKKAQHQFTNQFDYFVGTSTGGLISFCLAVGYDILDMKEIYSRAPYYFKKNFFGPLFQAKYDPCRIHAKINDVIGSITLRNGKKLSAEHATLLDIHNFLNPDVALPDEATEHLPVNHGNLLEFVDDNCVERIFHLDNETQPVKREKVLLITAYNATKDSIVIFNTSYSQHWNYRIADVLKSTMAAPTFFPPQPVVRGIVRDDRFIPDGAPPNMLVDGGIFANDPELAALWAIRMQWKKPVDFRLMSIGTGQYNTPLSYSTFGGYLGWFRNNGQLINTLMDATRSLTEVITSNWAKVDIMKRMKFNYRLTEAMSLDDPEFVRTFDNEWKSLKKEDDYLTLLHFYKKFVVGN